MSRPHVWLQAARPRTLPAAIGSVLVGAAAAAAAGPVRPGVLVATLATAVFLQIASNLANDLSDFVRGADAEGRLGPERVTQAGLVSPREMKVALGVVIAAALAAGSVLVWAGGWPIVVLGTLAIVAAITYTGGPWPYGYHGFGEVFVFLFFGIVAVVGTYFLQTGHVSWPALAVAAPPGCTVTAILVVNNLRDLDTDRTAGKRTLAVLIGDRASRLEYVLLMLSPFALVGALALTKVLPGGTLVLGLALPFVLPTVFRVWSGLSGAPLNAVLARTALHHLELCVLLAVGLLL